MNAALYATIALCLVSSAPARAAGELPVMAGRPAVASVNGDPIALEDLEREISLVHAGHGAEDRSQRRQNPTLLLDRMINARLMAQEAERIGLDELPEARKALEQQRLGAMRDLLLKREAAKVTEPDPAAVDRIYKNEVREYRVRSLSIKAEADAKDAYERLEKGERFDALADKLIAAKKAEQGDTAEWLQEGDLLREVRDAMEPLKPGQNTSIIPVSGGFVAVKLLEVRYPENPEARARARAVALQEKRAAATRTYVEKLRSQYATVDKKLLAQLDFNKDGAMKALAADKRALATIKGDAPVTVGDLVAGLNAKYFHGLDQAIKAKRVNEDKEPVLEDILNRRVVVVEARRVKLDQDPEFKAVVARDRESYLFGAFVQKAVLPEVKLGDADVEAFYKAHQAEYMGPEMLKLEALVFDARKDAEDALAKLQRGADFNWLEKTATGQADPAKRKLLNFPEGLVVATAVPEDLRKALSGAREGDYRFYAAGAGGPFYVVHLLARQEAKPVPFEGVRESVQKRAYDEKVSKAVDDWAAKLRKASDVKVFATGDALTKIVMRDLAAGS